jgi:hypothetical protein
MMRNDNNVESLISDDALRRMISMNNIISLKDDKLFIAAACGLFCMEE